VIVRDDKLDPSESALHQPQQKFAPVQPALAIGQFDRADLPPAVAIHRNRDQHRLAENAPVPAHPLVAHIEDQIGVALAQPPLGKGAQALVQARLMALMEGAEKLCPHKASATALTLRGDSSCLYISASAPIRAFYER
jgi:hypothetical protein